MTLTYVAFCVLLFCLIIYYRIHAERMGTERQEYLKKYSTSLAVCEDLSIILITVDICLEAPTYGLFVAVPIILVVNIAKGLIRKRFAKEDT